MKAIWIIAHNTYREIIRDRILYGLLVFALLLIGLSLALGQLSFAEQGKISIDFGFTAIHLASSIIAIFLGSSLVAKEIDKKTVYTLLVRPISRGQFLIGKTLGLFGVILTLNFGLSVILGVVAMGLGLTLNFGFFLGLLGILLENLILLGVSLFFSTFSRPIMVITFSIGVFLIGHWLPSLRFLSGRSQSQFFVQGAKAISSLIPNLEDFNWRSLFIYNQTVPIESVIASTILALGWFGLLITLANLVVRRRDFV